VKHFSEEAWSDFARKVISENEKMEMQAHIDSGCRPCAATLQVWRNVLVIAEKEHTFAPPDDVVRIAKSQFVSSPQASAGVRLLFDSNLQPIAAGIRGSIAATQFLFETDEFFIDLRLEPRREVDRTFLVGQVLKREGRGQGAQGMSICLHEGKEPIAQTSTNSLGEFQFEFAETNQLSIAIKRDVADPIVLPLYGIAGNLLKRKGLPGI
jgi:hypothetical protein